MKKSLALLISAGIASMQLVPVAAQVTEAEDEEVTALYADNSTIQNAQTVSLNGTFRRQNSNYKNFYKITLSEAGNLALKIKAEGNYRVRIYDENYQEINYQTIFTNGTTGIYSGTLDHYLNRGTYYICMETWYENGGYTVQTAFTKTGVSFEENQAGSNNTYETASTITLGNTYTGQLGLKDKKNFYKLVLPSSGELEISIRVKNGAYVYFDFYNSDLQSLGKSTDYLSSNSGSGLSNHTFLLNKGTYYIVMSAYVSDAVFTLTTSFTSANETFTEENLGSNNTMDQAMSISLNTDYKGLLAENDQSDYYKFYLSSGQDVKLTLFKEKGTVYNPELILYDSVGNKVSSLSGKADSITEKTVSLDPGYYYVKIGGTKCFYRFGVNTLTSGSNSGSNNNSSSSQSSGWSKNGSGKWQYRYSNGNLASGGWHKISGTWYYFDNNGNMLTGWLTENGKKYYLQSNGAMPSSQWLKINGDYYYFCLDGSMATERWIQYNKKWYYVYSNGRMACSTTRNIDGKTYKFNDDGSMVASKWVKNGSSWQYYGSSGAMVKNGWVKTGGKWYYCNSSGYMVTGWQTINKVRYYFNSDGSMASGGWKLINGNYYYFYPSGALATNTWINGHYVNSSGKRTN